MSSLVLWRKLVGAAIVLIILFPNAFYLSKAIEQPPEERLRRWLEENMVIYAFSPYRGPLYPTVGEYEEPTVTISSKEGTGQAVKTVKKSIPYSEFIKNYVMKGGQRIGGMNITVPSFVKRGPIVIEYKGYSLIYETAVEDPLLFAGGAYIASDYPQYSETSVEGDVVIFSFRFPIAESMFPSRPELLYSYSSLSNRSRLSLPIGEGLFLALGIKGVLPRDAMAGVLRNFSMFHPPLDRLIRSLPADDPMASVIAVEWSVEGRAGAIARAAPIEHPLITACGEYVISGSAMPVAPEAVEEAKRELIERLRSSGSFTLCERELRVLAPAGSMGSRVETLADLSEGPASLAHSTLVYYAFKPDVRSGEERVRVKIMAYRGAFELSFIITIAADGERFSIEESAFRFRRSDRSSEGSWGFMLYSEAGSLALRRGTRDEYGTAELLVEATDRNRLHMVTHGAFFTKEEVSYGETRTAGRALIGGWKPNPLPPGNSIVIEEVRHDFLSAYDSRLSEQYKSGEEGRGGLYVTTDQPDSRSEQQCIGRFSEEIISLMRRYPPYYISDVREVNFTNLYSSVERGGGSGGVGLLSLGNRLQLYTKTPDVRYEGREARIDGTQARKESSTATPPLLEACKSGCCVKVTYITSRILYYVEMSSGANSYAGTRTDPIERRATYALSDADQWGAAEEPQSLYLLADRSGAFAGESLTVSAVAYGKGAEGASASLSAELVVDGKNISVPVSPARLSLRQGAEAIARIRLPSVEEIIGNTGNERAGSGLLIVRASDSRGLNVIAAVQVYISGLYVVLNVTDVSLPIPSHSWDAPILSTVAKRWLTDSREGPPALSDSKIRASLYVQIVEEESERVVGFEYVGNVRSLRDGKVVVRIDPQNIRPGGRLYVKYDLTLDSFLAVRVKHAGIFLRVPDRLEGLVKIEERLYVPYTILAKYRELSVALSGDDKRYQRIMPDHRLFLSLPAGALKLVESATAPLAGPEGEALRGILGYMKSYVSSIAVLRPRVWLPVDNRFSSYTSELSVLGDGIDMRSVRFRLTPEDMASNQNNYWSQLAKFVMYEAEALRTFKYTTSSTILLAKILALAMTLEYFKGYFSYTKFWNKENLFAKMSKKVNLPAETMKRLKISKVASLFLTGEALGIFGIAAVFTNYNVATQLLNEITGSSEASALFISLLFKVIRFMFSYIVGEFRAEFRFEIIFLVLQAVIAHLLVMIHNAWTQYLLLREIMIEPYPATFDFTFILSTLANYVTGSLNMPAMSGGAKPQKDRWEARRETKGAIDAAIAWQSSEGLFYSVSDFYQLLEMFSALTLSVARGLDGAYEIERRRANVPDHEAFRVLLRFMNMPVEFKDARGQTVKVGVKDLIAKLYLALAAALVADIGMKLVWLPAFMNALVEEDPLYSNAAVMLVSTLQTVAPAMAAVFMARVRLEGSNGEPAGGLELSPPGGAEGELRALGSQIARGGEELLRMMSVSSYDLQKISSFLYAADRAEMIMRRAALATSNATLREGLLMSVHELVAARGSLVEVLAYHLSYPATEANADSMEVVKALVASMSGAVATASAALRGLGEQRSLPPTIVVREWDISWEDRGGVLDINVTLHNIGDEGAEVEVAVLAPSKISARTGVEARGSGEVSLRVRAMEKNLEILGLQLSINGRPSQHMEIAIPRGSLYREASSQDVVVISRGSVAIEQRALVAKEAEALLVKLPAHAEGQSYVAIVRDRILRTGEIRAGDEIILGAHFVRPFSAKIELAPVVVERQLRLEGSGSVSIGNIAVSSPASFSVKISMLKETEELRAALGRRGENVKYVAVDLLRAMSGAVTIEIELGAGVRRASIYKFVPEKGAFMEVSSHEVRDGKVRIELRPGDPIFAIVPSEDGVAGGVGEVVSSGIRALATALAILLAALVIWFVTIAWKRRRS